MSNDAHTMAGARNDFTWFDDERVIRFGRGALRDAEWLLRDRGFTGCALLTTERAEASALEVRNGADVILHVPHGGVPEAAAAVRPEVGERPLVALGGGRVIDVGKAIAAAEGLTCAAIPTTLSGAEMTRGHRMPAGVPEPTPVATPYWKWCQRPCLVIADPDLMASQPMPDLAASALNAMAHAAEALWTSYANPVADDAALRAAGLLFRSLQAPSVDRDGIALGALLAGFSVASAHIAFHHALCQTLARVTGAPHAHGNAVMLPHSLRVMQGREPRALALLGRALGGSTDDPAEAVVSIARLTAMVGPRTLAGIGVRHDQLDEVAEVAMGRAELGNMRQPLTAPEIRRLLEDAYEGKT